MNLLEYSIARRYAQLLKESETRVLTKKEQSVMEALRRSVDRYSQREISRAPTPVQVRTAPQA